MKEVSYIDQLNYVGRKYDTINGVPLESVPKNQLSAIYFRMVNPKKPKMPKQNPTDEYQMTMDDILKGDDTNG